MGDKIDTTKTVYQTGLPMYTPIDGFVRKEAGKFEHFERDHSALTLAYQAAPDPLLDGPYANLHDVPKGTPSPVPTLKPTQTPGPMRPTATETPRPMRKPGSVAPTATPTPNAPVSPVSKESRDGSGSVTSPPNSAQTPPTAPAGISRPIYAGGAPALRPDQMDEAVVNGDIVLRTLYSLPQKLSWVTTGYMAITRVAGPAGAILNLGYNLVSAKRILSDPHAPKFLKGGVVASTALAGVSAVTAGRLAVSAFGWAPMATGSLKLLGKISGVAGLGAGTIMSAMDTFNTFRDPNATSAQKGFSTLATGASLALTAVVLLGVTGPIGIGLGIAAIGFTLAKGWFGKSKVPNQIFGAIGNVAKKLKFW
jgi:hypothetical protein